MVANYLQDHYVREHLKLNAILEHSGEKELGHKKHELPDIRL